VNEAESSRREALRRGAIVAGGLAAAGALRPAFAVAQSTADDDLRDFLQQAIGLEQITVLAYSTAADSGDPKLKSAMEDFRDQEQAHASALRSALDELGFDPPDAPDSPSDGAVFDDVEGLDSDSSPYTAQDLKDLKRILAPSLNLLLHGHIHESKAIAKIGKTTCVNPGSAYSEGVIDGAVIDLRKDRVRSCQLVTG